MNVKENVKKSVQYITTPLIVKNKLKLT